MRVDERQATGGDFNTVTVKFWPIAPVRRPTSGNPGNPTEVDPLLTFATGS